MHTFTWKGFQVARANPPHSNLSACLWFIYWSCIICNPKSPPKPATPPHNLSQRSGDVRDYFNCALNKVNKNGSIKSGWRWQWLSRPEKTLEFQQFSWYKFVWRESTESDNGTTDRQANQSQVQFLSFNILATKLRTITTNRGEPNCK
jgi:hypothetical protein